MFPDFEITKLKLFLFLTLFIGFDLRLSTNSTFLFFIIAFIVSFIDTNKVKLNER